jgi:hypothetical protein
MLKNYKFDKKITASAINFLNNWEEIRLDKDIQNIFVELC